MFCFEKREWDWTPQHTEALSILKEELKTCQKLRPLYPQDPLRVEWGFAEHASFCGVFPKGPWGPARSLLFSSTSSKETAVKEAERLRTMQDIVGYFLLLSLRGGPGRHSMLI